MHSVGAGDYGLPLLCLEAEAYHEVVTHKHSNIFHFTITELSQQYTEKLNRQVFLNGDLRDMLY